MYEGSKIYANRIVNEPLLRATYFNMFGGEIFGNVLESKKTSRTGSGAIFVSERIMVYGGSIYKNIFNAKTSNEQNNMIGFFTTPANKDVVILDLKIGDTFVTGTGPNDISAMFGTVVNQFNNAKYYYNSNMQKGTRYTFSGTPTLTYDEQTGKNIWQVSGYSVQSENWTGRGWTRTDVGGDKAVVFLNATKKTIDDRTFDSYSLINAYIGGVYAYSGSTTITMPSGYALWSTSSNGYCHDGRAYTLGEVNSSATIILYTAYDAGKIDVDGSVVCAGGCGKVYACLNPEHDLQVIWVSYTNYSENGIKEIKCNTCNLENTAEASASPLFTCLGYSASEIGVAGVAIGYTVNEKAMKEYTDITGDILTYGVFAVSQEKLGDSSIFQNNGDVTNGVISVDVSKHGFEVFEIKIVGFAETQKDIKFAMGAYVAITNDGTTKYAYMQSGTPNSGAKYYFASYNEIMKAISK